MSIVLVRHGQASAGSADYDQLSATGKLQCHRLGAWLASSGQRFEAVVSGNMHRHRQSLEAIAAEYELCEVALPVAEIDHGLDEFNHHAVFEGFARQHPDHPAVVGRAQGGLRALGALIHAALGAWSRDAIDDVPESWAAFAARVAHAGTRLVERGNAQVLVMSSGGVASRLAQSALGASDQATIDLNLSLRNSATCEFHPRPYGLALGSWNALPHLHDRPELWTYY